MLGVRTESRSCIYKLTSGKLGIVSNGSSFNRRFARLVDLAKHKANAKSTFYIRAVKTQNL
jgi:hypothetical protein